MADNWERARLDHRARQSEAIARAALALIVERGASALSMAAIATAADTSRQTLYRYYPDIDAVLVGVAEVIASHDDQFEAHVLEQSDPAARLDAVVRTLAHAGGHDDQETAALRAALPPRARDVLRRHEDRVVHVLADVLRTGIEGGVFRDDVEPSTDAPLILALAAAADPATTERVIALVHRLVDVDTQENPT